ncbi:MAG TPA: trigger factor [Candidatus Eisenbacteria bacterium]|nr:trigger factor [Candidatus Eisenbacteria bacterium]
MSGLVSFRCGFGITDKIMRIDIDELSPIRRKLRIELPAEAVDHGFARAYRDLSRRVRIKGFRTGKAPRHILRGMYGDEIKGHVRSHLVEDSLGQAIRENGLRIVSRPEIEADDLEEGRGFTFSAIFEIKPEIEVKDYLGIEVERPKLSVGEAQVDRALEQLRESQARLEPVEDRDIVEPGDFVVLDFTGTIDGKPFPGNKAENYMIEVGAGRARAQFEQAVAGAKVGVEKTARVTFPPDDQNRAVAGKAVDFVIVVRDIKRKILPALDDEFAKDHGSYGSLDELKAAVRTRLEQELRQIQDDDLKEQILNRLIEAHPFTPPESLVERQTRYLVEQQNRTRQAAASAAPMGAEARARLEERAARQVRATLLLEKIAETEKIEVSDRDLQERIDVLARAAGAQAQTLRDFYEDADARGNLRAQMLFDRTLSFLLEHARVRDVDPAVLKVDDKNETS